MPSLEFKGKSLVYAHHLTVPYGPLIADSARSFAAASGSGSATPPPAHRF